MITVFTPTYNRAYILPVLFKSLQNQTDKNFEWIIVDDGSTDNTKHIIEEFLQIAFFKIHYFKKENQGKHIAINFAVNKAKGDLFFIVDSDDYLANNAIEYLNSKYSLIKNDNLIAGIGIAYRSIKNNKKLMLTKEIPNGEILSTYNKLTYKLNIKGEFATAFKTSIQKKYPYPYFEGENFFRESFVYRQIGKDYKTLYVDEPIYFADYLSDGLTIESWKILKKNPLGASFFFKELSKEDIPIKEKLIALNKYWDFEYNDIESSVFSKFKGVSLLLSVIVLINKKINFINLH
ncbi:glycosyltransferase family A protein [Faecalibacter macacae]|uniref:Glycosyltransferase family 2 protein n=1 Tax=Faecalibacter macacae TaxID=1859289 RepID=A0A3L9MJ22_9FLAO|nr:glycosyltransferase family 2 protein [Faecalibacter macacae]RLZ12705.1 glycosyltransferase family 2 protein [Faecalibacter macacae]